MKQCKSKNSKKIWLRGAPSSGALWVFLGKCAETNLKVDCTKMCRVPPNMFPSKTISDKIDFVHNIGKIKDNDWWKTKLWLKIKSQSHLCTESWCFFMTSMKLGKKLICLKWISAMVNFHEYYINKNNSPIWQYMS